MGESVIFVDANIRRCHFIKKQIGNINKQDITLPKIMTLYQ